MTDGTTQERRSAIDTLRISALEGRLEKTPEEWKQLALTDSKTGLKSDLWFKLCAAELYDEVVTKGKGEMGAIALDIDYFQIWNTQTGHPYADEVLKKVGDLINNEHEGIRKDSDVAIKMGGEEILILLPYSDLEGTMAAANRLRSEIQSLGNKLVMTPTLSAGVSHSTLLETSNVQELYKTADIAQSHAKRDGRNKVVPYVPKMEQVPYKKF